jgi:hypothetical protein
MICQSPRPGDYRAGPGDCHPDKLDELGPLPDGITVHLDAGYDSNKTPLNQKI